MLSFEEVINRGTIGVSCRLRVWRPNWQAQLWDGSMSKRRSGVLVSLGKEIQVAGLSIGRVIIRDAGSFLRCSPCVFQKDKSTIAVGWSGLFLRIPDLRKWLFRSTGTYNSAIGKVQDFCQKLGVSAACGGFISMRKAGRFVIWIASCKKLLHYAWITASIWLFLRSGQMKWEDFVIPPWVR